jgi:hypothetical protein
MKKIILLAVLLFSITIYAQKTVYILNYSSYPLYVGGVKTKPVSSNFPYYFTNNFSVANGLLNSGQVLILENVTNAVKFPFSFNSPQVTNLTVNNWRFFANASSLGATTPNSTAFNSNNSNNQIFDRASFRIGLGGSLGSFSLGIGLPTTVTGNGWIAEYSVNTDPAFPNLQETVILITDL